MKHIKIKEILEDRLKMIAEQKYSIMVVYNPNCECPLDQFIMLDRYPMSPKIIAKCPECKKTCLMLITNPIRFYFPWNAQDHSLEEIKKMVITPSNQTHFIRKYCNT